MGGGTGIAVKATHMPRVLGWHELPSKRATAMRMDYGDYKMVVVAVRLQPNMDVEDAKRDAEAKQVMSEIHELHGANDAVVVMGDWNQVADPRDRLTEREGQWVETKRCRGEQLQEMKMAGYIDAFREHTEVGGWTNEQKTTAGICKSRHDYIFIRSANPTLRVDEADVVELPAATTHNAVAVRVRGLLDTEPLWATRAVFRRVDLGACTTEQKAAFCADVHTKIRTQGEKIRMDLLNPTPKSVSRATKLWTSWVVKAANDNLQWSKQRMTNHERQVVLRLRAKRVRQAMKCAERPDAKSEGWRRKWATVTRRLDPDLRHPPDPGTAEWKAWNARLLQRKKRIRRLRKAVFKNPGRGPIKKADTDRYIQKILRGGRGNELDSVTRPDGTLAYDPAEVKETVERHIRSIAGRGSEAPVEMPEWYTDSDQRNQANHEYYQGIEDQFTVSEVLEILRALKWKVAPGPDGVPGGLLKLLVTKTVEGEPMATDEEVRGAAEMLRDLAWAIFEVKGRTQECWDSTTKPLWKKEGSKDPANIRPIALQNAIAKIPAAIVAKRLINVFDKHKILHPAQEAFIKHGRSENVLWTVLNIWSAARRRKSAYYNIMYDWIKAYDTLPWWALERAMDRLCIPAGIRDFVMGTLERARTKVRTAYGLTAWVHMLRGVKQGDPMAPIAYIMAMDILHDQVHHEVDGFRIGNIVIATKGYADDMWTGNDEWERLAKGHAVIVKVCEFLEIGIHPKKTALTGFEKDGSPIELDRQLPMPRGDPPLRATHKAQKLLGLWVQPPNTWKAQEGVLGYMVHNTATALRHSRLNLEQAVYALRAYLWPKLAYRLRFFPLKRTTANKWQQALNNATTRLGGGTRRIKPEALAYAMDYPMLYVQAMRAVAMEACRRLESRGSAGVTSRHDIHDDQRRGQELTGVGGTLLKTHLGALRSMGLALVWCRDKQRAPTSPMKPRNLVLDGKKVRIFDDSQAPLTQGWAEACVDGSLRKEDGWGYAGWAVVFVTDRLKQNWQKWVRDATPST
jgi:exonuclease III